MCASATLSRVAASPPVCRSLTGARLRAPRSARLLAISLFGLAANAGARDAQPALSTDHGATASLTPLVHLHSGEIFEAACQSEPLVTPLAGGGFLTLWRDSASSEGAPDENTWRRRVDASGQPAVEATSLTRHRLVAVANDSIGRPVAALVVATEAGGLAFEVLTLDLDGAPLGPPLALAINFPTTALFDMRFALASDGRMAVAWRESGRLMVQLVAATGIPVGPAVALAGVTGDLWHSGQLTFDRAGNAVAAWVANLPPSRVVIQRLTATGAPNGPPVHPGAGLAGAPTAIEGAPSLAATSDGGLAVAWDRAQPIVSDTARVYVQRYGPDGLASGEPLMAVDAHSFAPILAAGTTGELAVVWSTHEENFARRPWLRVLAGPGAATIPVALDPFNADNTGAEDTTPALAYLADGRLALAWEAFYYPNTLPTGCESLGIYARILDPDPPLLPPHPLAPNIQLSNGTAALVTTPRTPRLAGQPDGDWMAVWQAASCGPVVARIYDQLDLPRSNEVVVANPGCLDDLAATALAGGNYIAAWASDGSGSESTAGVFAQRLTTTGELLGVPITLSSAATSDLELAVGVGSGSGFLLAHRDLGAGLIAQAFDELGTATGSSHLIASASSSFRELWDLEALADGRSVIAWNDSLFTIQTQFLDAGGEPLGAAVTAVDDPLYEQGLPRLAAQPYGGYALAWTAFADPFPRGAVAKLRRFAPDGSPRGPVVIAETIPAYFGYADRYLYVRDLGASRDGTFWLLFVTSGEGGGGLWGVAVRDDQVIGPPVRLEETSSSSQPASLATSADGCGWRAIWGSILGSTHPINLRPVARRIVGGCLDSAVTPLMLGGARFELTATWWHPNGSSGTGQPLALSEQSGAFWFFSPDNPELLVKVLDGTGVNGAQWAFWAPLTDLGVDLRIVDTATGAQRLYHKPAGPPASFADIDAFPDGFPTASRIVADRELTWPRQPLASDLAQHDDLEPCGTSAAIPCLGGGRFRVEVRYLDPRDQNVYHALARPLGADGLAFWFFDPANVELVLKVLDGRALNAHFWVFFGALSDLDYTVTVTDLTDGSVWSHHNPSGTLTSLADTAALPRSCENCGGP